MPREPGIGLDRDRVTRRQRLRVDDLRREARPIAFVGQLAPELVHEQAPVREDEHADRARGLDEAGRGDRLARRGRMAEAIAADGAGVGADVLRLLDLAFQQLVVLVFLLDDCRLRVAVLAVPVFLGALVGGDQLGEHPGQRVDLVAPQLGAGGEMRRLLAEDALEPEHEREPDLPLGRGTCTAGLDLGDGLLECLSARRSRREHDGRILLFVDERLAGPRRSPEYHGLQAVRPGRGFRRLVDDLLHARSTRLVLQLRRRCAREAVQAASEA
jgi:hypothetical protein